MRTVISMLLLLALFACQKPDQSKATNPLPNGVRSGAVEEVLQATSYTYLKLKETDGEHWIAITKRELNPGTTVYYKPDLEMKDFESKDLQRSFKSIFFVSAISEQPDLNDGTKGMGMGMGRAHQTTPVATNISVEQPKDGVSIAQLAKDRTAYEGKIIIVRGQVTKYNPNIMGRNWVHIQDGTQSGNIFDLTVTTDDEVKKGDVVTFKGRIVLNKDFGAGYKYAIIMEEAKVVK